MAVAACSTSAGNGVPPSFPERVTLTLRQAQGCASRRQCGIWNGSTTTPIKHVVFILQENRSFNNLFLGYPGATTQNYGY
ncbi:MAG: hypothetical protein WB810_07800, partial [Candidatus Cybelea sp.]